MGDLGFGVWWGVLGLVLVGVEGKYGEDVVGGCGGVEKRGFDWERVRM